MMWVSDIQQSSRNLFLLFQVFKPFNKFRISKKLHEYIQLLQYEEYGQFVEILISPFNLLLTSSFKGLLKQKQGQTEGSQHKKKNLPNDHPIVAFERDLVRVVANMVHGNKHNQDKVNYLFSFYNNFPMRRFMIGYKNQWL